MKDYEIAVKSWPESDGWRGWSFSYEMNRYFFNDVPEDTFFNIWEELDVMQGVIRLD